MIRVCFLLASIIVSCLGAVPAPPAPISSPLARLHESPVFENRDHRLIHLKARRIDTESAAPLLETSAFSASDLLKSPSPQTNSLRQWIAHVKTPITDQAVQDINTYIAPYHLGQYLPQNSFVVVGPAEDAEFVNRLTSAPNVLFIEKLHGSLKVDPFFMNKAVSIQRHAIKNKVALQGQEELSPTLHHIRAHLAPEFGKSEQGVRELSAHWQFLLEELGESAAAELKHISSRYVDAKIPSTSLANVINWLADRNEVHWVEKVVKFETQNKYARYLIQSDVSNKTQMWQHGLHGEGQIIGLGDTGIDTNMCFFYDPDVPVPLNSVNQNHRKIVSYKFTGNTDSLDDVGGHGTHVAGSIVGEAVLSGAPFDPMSPYNGMAYKAKLAFYDFKTTNQNELFVPDNLYEDYFTEALAVGAHISSNSWGSPEGLYNSYCVDADRFVHDHDTFLPIFAAGNYGENGFFSVSTPGVSKNVLTVGACKSASESFAEQGSAIGIQVTSPASAIGQYPVEPAAFGPNFNQVHLSPNVEMVMAQPFDACNDLTNKAELHGKIALVVRGTCTFVPKAMRVQEAGAVMMIVVNNIDGKATTMGAGTGDPAPTIPSGMITRSDWLKISSSGFKMTANAPVNYASGDLNEDNLASFSSRGPTFDGRLKPDILAPGERIISAKSRGRQSPNMPHCSGSKDDDLKSMQGTSMATPVAAGGAALARQYFMEGYYPSGRATESDRRVPSAALLKAILISSSVGVGGHVFNKKKSFEELSAVLAAPSIYQGYGRMQLSNVLPFAGDERQPSLFVADAETLTTTGLKSYCFRVHPDALGFPSFRATLVWTDPAGSPVSTYVLVNNLDLFVVNENNREFFIGNNQHYREKDGASVPWDVLNNVEQVSIENIHADTKLSVHVRGTNIPRGPQAFALVVNGNFDVLPANQCSGSVICPNQCSGHGTCGPNGVCVCQGDWTSPDCSQASMAVQSSSASANTHTVSGSVGVNEWQYYYFDVTPERALSDLRIQLQRTSGKGDPDLYISHGSFPSLASYSWKISVCDSCTPAPTNNAIVIPKEQLREGRLRIGVTGYCCDPASYRITVSDAASGVAMTRSWYIVALTTLVILALILLAGFGYVYVKRARQGASQGHILLSPIVPTPPSAAAAVPAIASAPAPVPSGPRPSSAPPQAQAASIPHSQSVPLIAQPFSGPGFSLCTHREVEVVTAPMASPASE